MRLFPDASHTTLRNVAPTPQGHPTALCVCSLIAFLLLSPHSVPAQQIRYGYDDLGRLQWVQDQTGDVAIYVYDPVGNILQIVRGSFPDPNAPVGISAFAPAKGAPGTTVMVFGRGFDPSPVNNQVTFNGAPATLTAASPTQLTAAVPSGATTGPITVSAPAGSGSSAQSFTVLVAPAVTPAAAALFPKQTQVFTATQAAQWRVNNAAGGNVTLGTITLTGTSATYTPPAALPAAGLSVVITAANLDDFTLQGTATLEVLAAASPVEAAPVSVAQAPRIGDVVGLLPAPLLSVGLPPVAASPLVSSLLSVARTTPPLSASLLTSPLLAAAREPVVTAVQDPATGLPAKFPRGTANQNVRLRGAGFTGATGVVFDLTISPDPNIIVNSFIVDSATQVTANITIAPGATTGLRVARVTAGGVTSTAQGTGGNLLEVLP